MIAPSRGIVALVHREAGSRREAEPRCPNVRRTVVFVLAQSPDQRQKVSLGWAYPWGDDIGENNANCVGCGSQWTGSAGTWQTAPVGSFAADRFGLHDMIGNVWKWVQDCYHPNYNGAPTDGSTWTGGDCTARISSTAVPGAAGLSTSAQPSATWPLRMTGITPSAPRSIGRLLFIEAISLDLWGLGGEAPNHFFGRVAIWSHSLCPMA